MTSLHDLHGSFRPGIICSSLLHFVLQDAVSFSKSRVYLHNQTADKWMRLDRRWTEGAWPIHEMFDCDHHTVHASKNLFEGLYHLEEIWFQHWGMGSPCSTIHMLIQALLSYTIWLDHQRPKRAESPIESNRQYWVSDQKRLRLISWNSKEPTSSNCSRVSR